MVSFNDMPPNLHLGTGLDQQEIYLRQRFYIEQYSKE